MNNVKIGIDKCEVGLELGDFGDDGVVNNIVIFVGENRECFGFWFEVFDVGNYESF